MEIKDHLALIWRRAWLIALVAAVAALAVAGLVLRAPDEFRATATVAVPGLVGGEDGLFSGSNGNRAFVANFTAVAASTSILQKVSEQTGTSVRNIRNGLTVTVVGESTLIKVAFQSADKGRTEPVARGVASETLGFVFKPQANRAQAAVESSAKEVAAAQAAIDAFVAQTGLVDPDRTFQIKAQQIASLEEQAVAAAAKGEAAVAAGITSSVGALKGDLATLTPVLVQYRALTETKQRALSRLDQAQIRVEAAGDRLEASDPASAVSMSEAVAVSATAEAVRKAAAAAAAATFLVVLSLFAVESLFRPSADDDAAGAETEAETEAEPEIRLTDNEHDAPVYPAAARR